MTTAGMGIAHFLNVLACSQMEFQQTIRKPVECRGVGLHSGQPVRLILRPAPPGAGIRFRLLHRGGTTVAAHPDSLADSHYATTLGENGCRVQTVEHLLSATHALGIDNLEVELDAKELPALDGSAKPFVNLLYAAGRRVQTAPRRPVHVSEPIRVGDDGRWVEIVPAQDLWVSYTLDLDHPVVGTQSASFAVTERVFVEEVASARTYGFLSDLERLRENGLAKGGSLENAVVLGSDGILNGHLRFQDEFVRHKILDLIGDLAILGRPVIGHVVARNAGHALNHQLVMELHRRALAERLPQNGRARPQRRSVRSLEVPCRSEAEAVQDLPGLAAL